MKKSTFGILATLTLTFVPVAAFAQDTQTNIQNNTNSASAVGDANLILQNATQNSNQAQLGINGYLNPTNQLSVQGNTNAGAAIGGGNIVNQNAAQNNNQTQIDASQYIPAIDSYSNLGY
ncbi:hypothetical protein NIES4102_05360 [Chondrocystis sp. NIES-4102]|nr:hypothetical protein NIES4102_05360 [Chondrocystis sp. NIES-4102]